MKECHTLIRSENPLFFGGEELDHTLKISQLQTTEQQDFKKQKLRTERGVGKLN